MIHRRTWAFLCSSSRWAGQLRINEPSSLQTVKCQILDFPTIAEQKNLTCTCFIPLREATSSKGLSKDFPATGTVSRAQMSLRIKRCCSSTYFSNLAAWWPHSSGAAAVVSFPPTWHWKSKRWRVKEKSLVNKRPELQLSCADPLDEHNNNVPNTGGKITADSQAAI